MTGAIFRNGIEYGEKLKIILPLIGWGGFYLILFLTLPLEEFLVSLLLLILPILGFFRIFFVPSSDIDSYF